MRSRGSAGSPRLLESRRVVTLVLAGAFLWSAASVDWRAGIVHGGGLAAVGDIAAGMLTPDLSRDVLIKAAAGAWRTVAYAVAGLTVALAIGAPLGVLGSGVLHRSAVARRINVGAVRGFLALLRAVHELVWAWLFVAALGLSPMAAVLALGLPYGGILGRVYAELLLDVPDGPLRALRSAGASEWEVFWHGRLPIVLPDLLSYTFYRLECGIRSAAILSFVGLGGLGFEVQIALADLDFSRAWTFILTLVALVLAVDAWSSAVRRDLAI